MIYFNPIGYIYTPFQTVENMPIQSAAAKGVRGAIMLKEEFAAGLKDIEEFSHLYLIYQFHKCESHSLVVKPFLDDKTHGIFATRSPKRPCGIGISIVKLTGVNGRELSVENVDMMNETPLLDIKPYIPEFDVIEGEIKIGWYAAKPKKLNETKSDERFK
ncbi:MAG TPA: tRNA (N6-threonylcarbamoyladenosine(37)-N6)-methyltransferase TrmO [Candidatus Wallbacteria bacterium]|nr:MAG: S-adenosyl-L-methionine-binding protein [bacterium ADurb.Bin243]HOD40356.1 tRNA (N6-threonylcarbamoyladenosine(37)-N6)-methyltransferase TrmO [Candidatus Wallbacteria bacterium]HPG56396.1 tRNA (N6-threonylcarbamoyladenosine(37)-N6)-methyltransferase TrmO [Candidatus Wallbacteria bacterium]